MSGLETIRRLIPHRPPMLLVDRIVEVLPGERIVTVKAVSANEPWCGRLPDLADAAEYACPMALLVESWCQSAALLAAASAEGEPDPGAAVVISGMSEIEVCAEVYPGSLVHNEVRQTRAIAGAWFFEGEATVDGEPVLRIGELMTALRPMDAVRGGARPG